ncbi:hypothetical protein CEUSTIGMA_g313.t1 [Chlamydomonas eustigma]|uniref:Uncharacterized protein n=1 Tax=Chlamydomonas eustigma TaxID=1157962 RepID=A0A250WPV3_9CHLO|nr:hypothetical protein CEUSTIGMA_g313.t1 [Chlamydomonas eustigma]|eukprot:GAX72858.1 hypothetical protein CEUSTIGMA_g313.t1 [Chlamydomonas eustigma]
MSYLSRVPYSQPEFAPVVTLRIRAIFDLSPEFRYVNVEIFCKQLRKSYKTNTVPVVKGAALIEYWFRISADNHPENLDLKFYVEPSASKGSENILLRKISTTCLEATLQISQPSGSNHRQCYKVPILSPTSECHSEHPQGVLSTATVDGGQNESWQKRVLPLNPRGDLLQKFSTLAGLITHNVEVTPLLLNSSIHAHTDGISVSPHNPTLLNPSSPCKLAQQTSLVRPYVTPLLQPGLPGQQSLCAYSYSPTASLLPQASSGCSPPTSHQSIAIEMGQMELTGCYPASSVDVHLRATGVHSMAGTQREVVEEEDSVQQSPFEDLMSAPAATGMAAMNGPYMVVEYCLLWLPPTLARLPELDLSEPLSRSLHCYAHGGFMGAALSLMADPEWEHILMEAVEETGASPTALRMIGSHGLLSTLDSAVAVSSKDLLSFMTVLENSPVLCAYGLTRLACLVPALQAMPPGLQDHSAVSSSLWDIWWDSNRPDRPTRSCNCSLPCSFHEPCCRSKLYSSKFVQLGKSSATRTHKQPSQALLEAYNPGPQSIPQLLLQNQRYLLNPDGLPINRYGYSPLSLEWDLWLDPSNPSDLRSANVDHGSPSHLIQQAMTMMLGCEGLARLLGRRHNSKSGISPVKWLQQFGRSLSLGQRNNDPKQPLPLYCFQSSEETHLRAYSNGLACPSLQAFLEIKVDSLTMNMMMDEHESSQRDQTSVLACRLWLLGNAMSRPPLHLGTLRRLTSPQTSNMAATYCVYTHARSEVEAELAMPYAHNLTIYPVHHELATTVLLLEVYNVRRPSKIVACTIISLEGLLQQQKGDSTSRLNSRASSSVNDTEVKVQIRKALHTRQVEVHSSKQQKKPSRPEFRSNPDSNNLGTGQKSSRGLKPLSFVPFEVMMVPAQRPTMDRICDEEQAALLRRVGSLGTLTLEERQAPLTLLDIARAERTSRPDTLQREVGGSSPQEPRVVRGPSNELREQGENILEGFDVDGLEASSIGTGSKLSSTKSLDVLVVLDGGGGVARSNSGPHDFPDAKMCGTTPPDSSNRGSFINMTLLVRRTSVLEAAQRLYAIEPEAAQSYMAMLAAPGGLYLDIKSAYSKPQHLKWFVSTLEGIGVHVKAICSFAPHQLDFSALKDTTPYGGLSSRIREFFSIRDMNIKDPAVASRSAPLSVPLQSKEAASEPAACLPPHNPGHPASILQEISGAILNPKSGKIAKKPAFSSDSSAAALTRGSTSHTSGQDCEAEVPPPSFQKSSVSYVSPSSMEGSSLNPDSQSSIHDQSTAAEHDIGVCVEGGPAFTPVQFFHGLNGLELACERGRVPVGTTVLFNGASLVLDNATLTGERFAMNHSKAVAKSPLDSQSEEGVIETEGSQEQSLDRLSLIPDLIDLHSWQRYCTILHIFKLFCGIYVQEPDASAANIAALVQLVNNHPSHFPLGFAYGHLGSKAVAVKGLTGRGMAGQQLLEEYSSQEGLNRNVRRWIRSGIHLKSGEEVFISWGRRLLYSPGLLHLEHQRLLLRLIADYPSENKQLLRVVEGIGGVKELFLRFFKHYTAFSPFTVFELGFYLNHTKALLRLLRNRGVFSSISSSEKLELSLWLLNSGNGQLARPLHYLGRADLHKLAKEALLCLLESCSHKEVKQIILSWGGYKEVQRSLRGWFHCQGLSYESRLKAIFQHHALRPSDPAYPFTRYGYLKYAHSGTFGSTLSLLQLIRSQKVRLSPDGVLLTTDPTFTFGKGTLCCMWLCIVRTLNCTCSWACHCVCLNMLTCCLWSLYSCPMLLYPYCGGSRLLPVIIALIFVSSCWGLFIVIALEAFRQYQLILSLSLNTTHAQSDVNSSLKMF